MQNTTPKTKKAYRNAPPPGVFNQRATQYIGHLTEEQFTMLLESDDLLTRLDGHSYSKSVTQHTIEVYVSFGESKGVKKKMRKFALENRAFGEVLGVFQTCEEWRSRPPKDDENELLMEIRELMRQRELQAEDKSSTIEDLLEAMKENLEEKKTLKPQEEEQKTMKENVMKGVRRRTLPLKEAPEIKVREVPTRPIAVVGEPKYYSRSVWEEGKWSVIFFVFVFLFWVIYRRFEE